MLVTFSFAPKVFSFINTFGFSCAFWLMPLSKYFIPIQINWFWGIRTNLLSSWIDLILASFQIVEFSTWDVLVQFSHRRQNHSLLCFDTLIFAFPSTCTPHHPQYSHQTLPNVILTLYFLDIPEYIFQLSPAQSCAVEHTAEADQHARAHARAHASGSGLSHLDKQAGSGASRQF